MGLSVGCGASTAFSFSDGGLGLGCRNGRSRVVGLLRTNGIDVAANGSLVHNTASLFNIHTSLRFKGLGLRAIVDRRRDRSGAIGDGKKTRAVPFSFSTSRCSRGQRFFLTRCFHSACSRGVTRLPGVLSKIGVGQIRI